MPNKPLEDPEQVTTADLLGGDAYATPPELAATVADDGGGGERGRAPRSGVLKVAAVLVAVLLVGAALLAYRAHHRRKVLAEGLAKADALLRLDTAAGYRQAATLLEPLAQLDPSDAASVRAFALAMLVADYRGAELEGDADALLVAPSRAEVVPVHAYLAGAALSLARREAGNAATSAARAGEGPWARTLQARVAFLAGNLPAALDPAASAAAEGAFPPGLSVHGDVLRRLRKDPRAARAAYEAALAASPLEPRPAYGLAKLALAGQAPLDGAAAALQRLVSDIDGTPAPERGRAALHLAALHLRAGNRAAADAALDALGLDAAGRAWAARAATLEAENRGPYRAVTGAPAALQSASDDDPGELSPAPPPPPPKPAAKPQAKAKKAVAKPASKKGAKKATAKAAKKDPRKDAKKKAAKKKKPATQG